MNTVCAAPMAPPKKYKSDGERLAARKAQQRAHYDRNKKEALARSRARYIANKGRPITKPRKYFTDEARREGRRAVGRRGYANNAEERKAKAAAYYKSNQRKVRQRQNHLKRFYRYGIQDYDARLAAQGGACACCGMKEPGGHGNFFHVDHCHKTGQVRAILCQRCNTGLGQFGDDVERLKLAIAYLERWR